MRAHVVLALSLLSSVGLPGSVFAQAVAPIPPPPTVLQGVVIDVAGQPKYGVVIRLTPGTPGPDIASANTDKSGKFEFPEATPGTYTVDVLGDGYPPASRSVTIAAGETVTLNIISRPVRDKRYAIWLVIGVILAFSASLLAFRHHNIVQTNRELLRAQLENIATRIPLESDPARSADANELWRRVVSIREKVDDHLTWREWFFWSRGREIGAWSRLHEVERQLVAFLVPEARVVERSISAEAQLREITSTAAAALADRLHVTLLPILAVPASQLVDPHILEHLKQQLGEALSMIYDDADKRFAQLMEWHNKAMWLVYLGLIVIGVVSWVFGHEELFLLGAAGGLMSRMARSLLRADVPSDYGASWTTLFLSPLMGAISAWFGIALIVWLRQMGVLGDKLFMQIQWNGEVDALMIGMAFALGFSERLFTSLVTAVDGRVTTALTTTTAAASRPPVTGGGGGGAGQLSSVAIAGGTASASSEARLELFLKELDVQPGERAAFIGKAASATRAELLKRLGVDGVVDATAADVGARAPLDAVLFETPPTVAELTLASQTLFEALRPDGRVVVVGSTPLASFESDAASLRTQDQLGPTLVQELLTTAGFAAQEPASQLNDTDPVEWMAAFVKPTPGGSDR